MKKYKLTRSERATIARKKGKSPWHKQMKSICESRKTLMNRKWVWEE